MATNKDFRVKKGLVVTENLSVGGNVSITGDISSTRLDTAYSHANGAFDLANGTAGIANTDYTTVSTTAGTYGTASLIPSVTRAANGRVTNVSNVSISIPSASYADGSNSSIFVANTNVTGNVTLSAGTGGLSVGPVTVAVGQSVTIESGVRWVVV